MLYFGLSEHDSAQRKLHVTLMILMHINGRIPILWVIFCKKNLNFNYAKHKAVNIVLTDELSPEKS